MRVMVEMIRTGKQPDEILREMKDEGPPYELLLNLTGEEFSYLNAKATLRQIASDNTVEGHEEFLHGVRLHILLHGGTEKEAVQFHLRHTPFYKGRVEAMSECGYMCQTPAIPGLMQPTSEEKASGHAHRQ